jgi:hypothetical protein
MVNLKKAACLCFTKKIRKNTIGGRIFGFLHGILWRGGCKVVVASVSIRRRPFSGIRLSLALFSRTMERVPGYHLWVSTQRRPFIGLWLISLSSQPYWVYLWQTANNQLTYQQRVDRRKRSRTERSTYAGCWIERCMLSWEQNGVRWVRNRKE